MRYRMKWAVLGGAIFGLATSSFAAASNAANPWDALAEYNEDEGGVSLIVIVDGVTVAEDYPNARMSRRGRNLASGTKSFNAAIAAAAVQDGLMVLDEPVADTITEWADGPKSAITIRHLLTLTSGLEGGEGIGSVNISYRDAMMVPLASPPGEAFAYSPVPFQVFGEVMRRKLEAAFPGEYVDPGAYLQARIFDKLEIEPTSWRRTDDDVRLASGMSMTARDWATYGEFLLAEGMWQGEQLVDAETLQAARKGTSANPAYGLSFWLLRPVDGGVTGDIGPMQNVLDVFDALPAEHIPEDTYMAAGAANQRLYIFPTRNMVVVRQQPLRARSMGQRSSFSDDEFLRLIDLGYRMSQ